MGRKSRKSAKGAQIDDGDDVPDDFTVLGSDDGDDTEDWSEGGGEDDGYKRIRDAVEGMDEMTAKSESRRVEGYRRFYKSICVDGGSDVGRGVLEGCLETFQDALADALRRGSVEQYLSCRCVEAMAVCLGGGNDDFYDAVGKRLRAVVMGTGRDCRVRAGAAAALAITNLICVEDVGAVWEVMDMMEEASKAEWRGANNPPQLRAAAVDAWSLLATAVDDRMIAGDGERGYRILPLLRDCLDHDDPDLRASAGECVALIHEARLGLGLKEEDASNTTDRRYRRGSWDGTEFEALIDEVKIRLEELSVESGKRLSKKAKKAQRATFREYLSTISEGESPTVSVSFTGGTLELSTWRERKQLDAVRSAVQGGLMSQLSSNSTLQDMFGCDMSVLGGDGTMSSFEKRMYRSKNSEKSKAADRDRKKGRDVRANVQNYFLSADGEDI